MREISQNAGFPSHARKRSKTIKPACSATSAMRGRTCDAYQTLCIRITKDDQTITNRRKLVLLPVPITDFHRLVFSTTSPESEITDDECEDTGTFDDIRHDHPSGFIAAYLNINSARNKIIHIREALKRTPVDILGIAESKIDDSFPDSQFTIDGYRLFRRDRNDKGGGVMVYSLRHPMSSCHRL